MRLRVVVLAAALALAAPATASANAVVSTEDAGATVVVDSDALEYNVITVWVAADRVVVRESISGGAITAGPGCDQDSEDEASCPAAGVQRVRVWLGDGDDDFHGGDVGSLRLEVHGEGGNDIVNDGPGDDLLDGGEGWNDVMRPSGGDDEVRGGGGESDLVSYLSYSEGVEVTLPAPGASSTGNGAATEDDTVHGDVEEARGGSGPDSLTGNGGSNALGGGPGEDVVAGGEGADVVNGMSGPDTMDGGPGNDRVFAEDYEADTSIDCGGGDDDLIADNAYDAGSGCEVVAPELDGWPSLATGTFRAGDWIALLMPPVSGTAYSTSAVWRACDAAICAPSSRGDASGYRAADEDVGKRVFARVRVENRAGAAEATTEWTGVIGRRPAAPAPAPPPADPEPPATPPPSPPPAPPSGDPGPSPFARLADELRAALTELARGHDGADPRRLARRRVVRHRLRLPAAGIVTVRWLAGGRVIASGRADGDAGQTATVTLRLTKRGRALLRRARRLELTLEASFVGGPATKAAPAVASTTFRLRRRRRAT